MKFKFTTKEIPFTLLLIVGKMKWFRFRSGPRKMAHSVKANHFCFVEVNACADVSFCMSLLQVVFTWQLITWNEISFLSKRCSEITTAMSFILSCIKNWLVIRNWPVTEMKIFYFTRNEISCKHPLTHNSFSWLVVFIMGIWRHHGPKHLQLFLQPSNFSIFCCSK